MTEIWLSNYERKIIGELFNAQEFQNTMTVSPPSIHVIKNPDVMTWCDSLLFYLHDKSHHSPKAVTPPVPKVQSKPNKKSSTLWSRHGFQFGAGAGFVSPDLIFYPAFSMEVYRDWIFVQFSGKLRVYSIDEGTTVNKYKAPENGKLTLGILSFLLGYQWEPSLHSYATVGVGFQQIQPNFETLNYDKESSPPEHSFSFHPFLYGTTAEASIRKIWNIPSSDYSFWGFKGTLSYEYVPDVKYFNKPQHSLYMDIQFLFLFGGYR
ncbi:MAG: hypothetical protein OCD01_05010 [Fibrobacterales bacterium]